MKVLFLSFILLFLTAKPSEARLYIVVDQPSENRFPIAVTDLVPEEGKKSKPWSQQLTKKIRDDLELSGLFDLIDSSSYPSNPEALSPNPATIQFGPWTLIGAQALVTGSYSLTEEGAKISLHLYDPFLGQHLVGRNYNAKESEIGIIAHHFSDEILQALTGERGVFSTQIAFVCLIGKKKEICSMDMDGGNQRQLTRHRSIAISPAWSPSGKQIAYTTFKSGENPEIFVLTAGGEPEQVTATGGINLSPTWTPKGQLAVAMGMSGDADLFLLNLKGKVLQQLTDSFGIDINPSLSPDGRAFVFASERAGRLHIFRADSSGRQVRRLTFVGYHNDNPDWSPRGDKIVFQGRDQGVWDLFIMNSDGSMIQRLTSESGNNESPSWAPNGRYITFASTRNGPSQIFIMREDGSNQIHVGPRIESRQPDWSPWFK
ncbi:MAG: Tol-Pal system beta propeller repeat protein TolB [Deltaproteobacteria bacterium]|nr:Tol-Pal system beta propeller repeat protein TolB [Deltaproteobacteria bacterium]